MEKITIETIKKDSIIDLQVSGAFYQCLQQVLQELTFGRESEVGDLITKINDEVPDDEFSDWELACQTMMILCAEIEGKAREQKKTTMEEIDAPTQSDNQSDTQSAS